MPCPPPPLIQAISKKSTSLQSGCVTPNLKKSNTKVESSYIRSFSEARISYVWFPVQSPSPLGTDAATLRAAAEGKGDGHLFALRFKKGGGRVAATAHKVRDCPCRRGYMFSFLFVLLSYEFVIKFWFDYSCSASAAAALPPPLFQLW